MNPEQQEILDIFTRTKALLSGHFVLRSGLHSGHYFQCAQVCQQMDAGYERTLRSNPQIEEKKKRTPLVDLFNERIP